MLRSPIGRNLAGCLAVLAALALITLGPLALNTALPTQRPVPAGQPLALGDLPVTVVPPPGARLDATETDPGTNTVQFVVGDVEYWLQAEEFDGSLAELAQQTRERIRRWEGFQSVDAERDTSTRQGVAGRQADFTLTDEVGRYAVFLAGGIAVKVTVTGDAQSLGQVAADLDASIAGITIGRPR
jgi:hypothetical protein